MWVADRLDLALLLEADRCTWAKSQRHREQARRLLPGFRAHPRAWMSRIRRGSRRRARGRRHAVALPLLASRKGRAALGLAALGVLGEQLRARNLAYPLYALGGVSADNASACLAAGAAGVAAIGAALAPDARGLLDALGIGA